MNAIKGLLVIALWLCSPLASFDIFAEEENDQLGNYNDLAGITSQAVQSGSTFIFNPKKLHWSVYDANGKLLGSGHASGGRDFCPDIQEPCRTPVGTFQIDSLGDESCSSSIYPVGEGGTPMPYCMHVNADFSIHGSNDTPNYNASHGCIRVKPSIARWLRYNVLDIGSTVIVLPY